MARKASPKPKDPVKWVELPTSLYKATSEHLVLFSFKTINSNIAAGGVRLCRQDGLNLPYVSARTLIASGAVLALDYPANAGKTATAVKQINLSLAGQAPEEHRQQAQTICDIYRQATIDHFETGTEEIDPRARQLLLPRADGSYVATTPVSAAGVCQMIRQALIHHAEQCKENTGLRRIPTAVFGLGGANPQNVGALVRSMQRPVVSFSPTESRELKRALAWYHRGLTVRLPRALMRDLRTWYNDVRAGHGGRIPTNQRTRNAEAGLVATIANAILERGASVHRQLQSMADYLPERGDPIVSENVPSLLRGLIDPKLREKDWPRRFAQQLAVQITDYDFADAQGGFQFSQSDLNTLERLIEKVLP